MLFTPKNIKKFQLGGEIAPVEEPMTPEAAPALEAGLDPMMMLAEAAAQALLALDCLIAMQVCQVFLEILQQMSGGAPQEPQGEPVFAKNGAKLIKRIPRNR